MVKAKYLGIWMDHSIAYLMGLSTEPIETKIIKSKSTHDEHSTSRGENQMHNKEQQVQAEYYKELSEIIINYDEVILFGPTSAKVELLNILKDDHHFDKIKIDVEQTDKMTENQQHAFIREYFLKN